MNEVGEGAFCNCINLDLVEIPDSVIKIDDCAFRGCIGMTEIKIPESVTDLGWGIFDGCESNITVKCRENSEIFKYFKNMVLQPILTMKRRMTKNSMECVKKFIRKNTVMCIAFIAAVITSFIIPIETARKKLCK